MRRVIKGRVVDTERDRTIIEYTPESIEFEGVYEALKFNTSRQQYYEHYWTGKSAPEDPEEHRIRLVDKATAKSIYKDIAVSNYDARFRHEP